MQINILVIQKEIKETTGPSGKSYKVAEIAYKNLGSGKLEEGKVNSYSKCFKEASNLESGQSFSVEKEKNDAGFWNWISIKPLTEQSTTKPTVPTNPTSLVKSTYETPEERAKKQIYIIRQSSISNAIHMLSIGATQALPTEGVLNLAQVLSNWVLNPNPVYAFDDLPDDIPIT